MPVDALKRALLANSALAVGLAADDFYLQRGSASAAAPSKLRTNDGYLGAYSGEAWGLDGGCQQIYRHPDVPERGARG